MSRKLTESYSLQFHVENIRYIYKAYNYEPSTDLIESFDDIYKLSYKIIQNFFIIISEEKETAYFDTKIKNLVLVNNNQIRISSKNTLAQFAYIYSQICYLNTQKSEDFNKDK